MKTKSGNSIFNYKKIEISFNTISDSGNVNPYTYPWNTESLVVGQPLPGYEAFILVSESEIHSTDPQQLFTKLVGYNN